MPTDGGSPQRPARTRRRDRHGRGLRGVLVPPGVPLHRTRPERFDDLVLQAVARLEPLWEAHLSGIEFAVEEIPPADAAGTGPRGPVPLSRLEPGSDQAGTGKADTGRAGGDEAGKGAAGKGAAGKGAAGRDTAGERAAAGEPQAGRRPDALIAREAGDGEAGDPRPQPPRIVVYRRPLMLRADGEEDLGELVFDVVVEEFARLLGIDPGDVDTGYAGGD